MRLIEADERQAFLATLQRKGLAEGEFELLETDTTDPKGDESVGLQGYVTITRLSTQIARDTPSASRPVGCSISDRISKLASSISRNEIPQLRRTLRAGQAGMAKWKRDQRPGRE